MNSKQRELHGEPIPASDLILNEDGSIFHLHLYPEQVPETVILVGDPGRVPPVGRHLTGVEEIANTREFRAMLGEYHGKRILVQSTGIGAGCIDITLNELDALVNIDFASRRCYQQPRSLSLLRIGTSGTLRSDIANGEAIITSLSIGFDLIPWLYQEGPSIFEASAVRAFTSAFYTLGNQQLVSLYAVRSDAELVTKLAPLGRKGITYCCPGFYGPQLRQLRLHATNQALFDAASNVIYNGERVLNMEMESGPLNALAAMLGHRAVTITLAIDNRREETVKVDYAEAMDELIERTLAAVKA